VVAARDHAANHQAHGAIDVGYGDAQKRGAIAIDVKTQIRTTIRARVANVARSCLRAEHSLDLGGCLPQQRQVVAEQPHGKRSIHGWAVLEFMQLDARPRDLAKGRTNSVCRCLQLGRSHGCELGEYVGDVGVLVAWAHVVVDRRMALAYHGGRHVHLGKTSEHRLDIAGDGIGLGQAGAVFGFDLHHELRQACLWE
jgi:hypothetical protein